MRFGSLFCELRLVRTYLLIRNFFFLVLVFEKVLSVLYKFIINIK
jgi:hypothetical protein